MATASAGRVAAALVVGGVAVARAVLHALVGFGLRPAPGGWPAGGLGSLVAIAGGVKLAVAAGGLAVRFSTARWLRVASASVD